MKLTTDFHLAAIELHSNPPYVITVWEGTTLPITFFKLILTEEVLFSNSRVRWCNAHAAFTQCNLFLLQRSFIPTAL